MLIAAVFRNRPWIGEMVVFVMKQAPASLFCWYLPMMLSFVLVSHRQVRRAPERAY